MPKSDTDPKIHKIALLVALACVLQISESLIPHPVPGLRLGLANMITLTALLELGFGYALEVAILRTLLSSIILGTFMSPIFILSFAAAVISTLVMGFFYWLSGIHPRLRLSIIGISIIGAFTHNLAQLYFAYLLLIKHKGIFVLFPWLSIGAVATGWVVGIVAGGICRRLREPSAPAVSVVYPSDGGGGRLTLRSDVPGSSPLHRLPAEIKLGAVFVLALAVLIFDHFLLYAGLFFLISAMALISRTPFGFLLGKVRKYRSLILVSFLLPLFFTSGARPLVTIASMPITHEGLVAGLLFTARILFLIMASTLVMRTTTPGDLTQGLDRILTPLRLIGISSRRIAVILSLAWTAVPWLWATTRNAIFSADLKRTGNLKGLLPRLSNLIAMLYLQTEPEQALWKEAQPSGNRIRKP